MDEYDVFISHASEDKDAVARPIAEALRSYGVDVWFDEFSLTLGDSLSRSIDKGLSKSRFGLVVLSPSFFSKNWPEYELRGLTAKEMHGGKVVLPIWHQVDISDVLEFSPPLADKLAINTSAKDPDRIALEIISVIRPDILTKIHRRQAFLEVMASAEFKTVAPDQIKLSPPKHDSLPDQLIGRIRLIRAALLDVYPHSMKYWVDGFRGDAHPSKEISFWEHLAACYVEFTHSRGINTPELRQAVYSVLMGISLQQGEGDLTEDLSHLPEGSFSLLRSMWQHSYPPLDSDETFPASGSDMSEAERQEWLAGTDREDYDSLDRHLTE